MHETNDAKKLQELVVRDDIALLLYQSGFGNECLTIDSKCKALQYILFNQVFKTRRDQITALIEGLNSLGVLELLRANEACGALVFPLHSKVQISEQDVISLLEYEEHLSYQEEQGKIWLEEYVKLLGRGNIFCHSDSVLPFSEPT